MLWLQQTWLYGLVAVVVIALIAGLSLIRRRRAVVRMMGPALADRASARAGIRPARAWARAAAALLALACITAALARPAWNPVPVPATRSGRDVAILLDVSRSMLAQDLRPNRLERAKLAVKDMLDVAKGDRFALIAFAGSSVVKCPLTTDYGFVRLALDDVTPDTISRGGTMIGDAVRTAMDQVFDTDEASQSEYRDMIIFTDGEDHESFPTEAAAAAAKKGVRIITVGLGNDQDGSAVPVATRTGAPGELTYEGRPVRTKMNPDSLRRIAEATPGGVFLNMGTGNADFDRLYERLMSGASRREISDTASMRYTEGFQFLLIPALALLILEGLIGERPRRS
ncbi:MAG: VWA domain-containing protein [Phycisphaeraceae bacterium]|nr:VWA domain-containing protein [Phycisphaeraceae bacterium]